MVGKRESDNSIRKRDNRTLSLIVGDICSTLRAEGGFAISGYAFDVSVELKSLGQTPLPACRIGNDVTGQGIKRKLAALSICPDLVETDAHRATSRCIKFDDLPPKLEAGASDFLANFDAILERTQDARLFSFNTVLLRTPGSRGMIFNVLEGALPKRRHVELDLARVGSMLEGRDILFAVQMADAVSFTELDSSLICEALELPELSWKQLADVLKERFDKKWVLATGLDATMYVVTPQGSADSGTQAIPTAARGKLLARFLTTIETESSPEAICEVCLHG